jgi:hypothetical protein
VNGAHKDDIPIKAGILNHKSNTAN